MTQTVEEEDAEDDGGEVSVLLLISLLSLRANDVSSTGQPGGMVHKFK